MNIDIEVTEDELKEWQEEDAEIDENPSENQKDITAKYESSQLRIIRTNIDYNLDFLNQSLSNNIKLDPIYQRRSRWDNRKKSLLIESILMNIPIPPIFLYEREYYQYEVIDGRQRLEAIKGYFNDEYSLRGLEYWKEINGRKFSQLPLDIQRGLLRRTINATVLLAETNHVVNDNQDIDVRMVLFNRLNTGGVILNAQELRNALYGGSFNKLLFDLAESDIFREVFNIPNPNLFKEDSRNRTKVTAQLEKHVLYKSMTDCELVLRYFAIKELYHNNNYKGSLKGLLDYTALKYQNVGSQIIAEFKEEYLNMLLDLKEIFGDDLFVNLKLTPPKLARNLYDSLSVGYQSINNKRRLLDKEIIKRNLNFILENTEEYEIIISKGNSIDAIIYRVEKAIQIFTTILQ